MAKQTPSPQPEPLPVQPIPQQPWYQNAVAVMGYGAQVFGVLMIVASVVLAMSAAGQLPGLPPWLVMLCGVIVAVGAKLGLDKHSADVRVAELASTTTQATTVTQFSAPGQVPEAAPKS